MLTSSAANAVQFIRHPPSDIRHPPSAIRSSFALPSPGKADDREAARPAVYDVFEPDGQYLGQVQVTPRVSSVVRRGDQVWGIATDDDDVPRIKRYRIAWRR